MANIIPGRGTASATGGSTIPTATEGVRESVVVEDARALTLQENILVELKIMNEYSSQLAGAPLTEDDVEA